VTSSGEQKNTKTQPQTKNQSLKTCDHESQHM